ncbi:hypothetical protein SteCoe_11638 [Stentor coeruleus]|uniref:Ankyrin repeat protein n=1 Tax=Stentor coeruleus TaxID=5963 RepID=A0A1R2CCQ9_9CILI|nr:hypothetical protein SteCoe_11638 [Stentor coeruleus]
MGCHECRSQGIKEYSVVKRMQQYINNDDKGSLESLLTQMAKDKKNQTEEILLKRCINIGTKFFNPPSYAAWIGSSNCFFLFTSKFKDLIIAIEEFFIGEKLSLMSYICEKGYFDIFKHYLPFYVAKFNKLQEGNSLTLLNQLSFSTRCLNTEIPNYYTPIQIATSQGHINIVHYTINYFSQENPPYTLNIHHLNNETWENCALISLKKCNFVMMKLLYEAGEAEFGLSNKEGETAIEILTSASRTKSNFQYIECIMYLIDVIKIDIMQKHEEILLQLENRVVIKFFEEKLKNLGILVTKEDLENVYYKKPSKVLFSNEFMERETQSPSELSEIPEESNRTGFLGSLSIPCE